MYVSGDRQIAQTERDSIDRGKHSVERKSKRVRRERESDGKK